MGGLREALFKNKDGLIAREEKKEEEKKRPEYSLELILLDS